MYFEVIFFPTKEYIGGIRRGDLRVFSLRIWYIFEGIYIRVLLFDSYRHMLCCSIYIEICRQWGFRQSI